jgi:DNA/RNA-binding domain of Phe-tRNA-synthetase-like protein
MVAEGCDCGPSPAALESEVRASCERAVSARESERSAARRAAVRDLLRHGAYKPTGRGKPASEYLLNAAAEGQFPLINAAVDINNLVSVESLLPISLVDLDRAGTESFLCRRGRTGEAYVFNPSGQILDLQDLLLVAREPHDEPCATPVKDSQATKTRPETRRVLGVVYAPDGMSREAEWAAARMSELFAAHCGAATRWGLLRE